MTSARLPPQNYSPRLAARRGGAARRRKRQTPQCAGPPGAGGPRHPLRLRRGWERGGFRAGCSVRRSRLTLTSGGGRVGAGAASLQGFPAAAEALGLRAGRALSPAAWEAGRAGEGGAAHAELGRRLWGAAPGPPRWQGRSPVPAAAGGRRGVNPPLNRCLAREEAGAPQGRQGRSLTEQVRSSPGRACGASFSHVPLLLSRTDHLTRDTRSRAASVTPNTEVGVAARRQQNQSNVRSRYLGSGLRAPEPLQSPRSQARSSVSFSPALLAAS